MPDLKVIFTTKNVATLLQLESSGQLKLPPEFQREGLWPKAAKAYFVDSILNGRQLPPIYLLRTTSVQTDRTKFAVMDGQQRVRVLKDFLDDGFGLIKVGKVGVAKGYKGKKFSRLSLQMQQRLLNFDFVVLELSGYSKAVIQEVLTHMSKHVVRLSKQELRKLNDLSTRAGHSSMR